MTEHALEKERIRKMQMRIDYLEKLSRGHLFSSDLLVSLGEFQHDARINRDPAKIFQFARQQLKQLLGFRILAFFMVDENSSDFVLTDFEPESSRSSIQKEIDTLVENGTFAWAINQNRPVVVKSNQFEENLILHVLATKSRVRGMFAGVVENADHTLNDTVLHSLSIILQSTANSLESAALYQMMHDHNQNLEKTVANLTSEIRVQVNLIRSGNELLRNKMRETGQSALMDSLTQIDSASKKLLDLIDKTPDS